MLGFINLDLFIRAFGGWWLRHESVHARLSHLLCWNLDQDTKDSVRLYLHHQDSVTLVTNSGLSDFLFDFRLSTFDFFFFWHRTKASGDIWAGALLSFPLSYVYRCFLFVFIPSRVALRRSHIQQFRLTWLMINVPTDDMQSSHNTTTILKTFDSLLVTSGSDTYSGSKESGTDGWSRLTRPAPLVSQEPGVKTTSDTLRPGGKWLLPLPLLCLT